MEAKTVVARIHALAPSPGSYFDYNNEKLKMLINKKNKLRNDPRPVYISSNY